MEFRFNLNEIFKKPIVEVGQTLIPSDFKGDRRGLWDALSKITDVINAMGSASATAQNLTRPITTADRLRNSEQQQVYLLIDHDAYEGKGAVTGMLKTGKKGLYVFDRDGHHYHVQSPCVLDFYIHESKQRSGFGKKLFEHMLQREEVHPEKLAIDRPSEKFLGFLNKHYNLNNPIRQMNNYVVYDGFFPQVSDKSDKSPINNNGDSVSKRGSNGLQAQIVTSPYGRYGAPRPPCSMGQIIHNQSAAMPVQEPTGELIKHTADARCIPYQQNNSIQEAVSARADYAEKRTVGGGSGTVEGNTGIEYHWPFVIPSADYPMQIKHNTYTSGNMYDLLQPGLIKHEFVPPAKVPLDELGRPQQNLPQKQMHYRMVHRQESCMTNPAVHHINKAHQANKVVDESLRGATKFNHFSQPTSKQIQTGSTLYFPEEQQYSNMYQQNGNYQQWNNNNNLSGAGPGYYDQQWVQNVDTTANMQSQHNIHDHQYQQVHAINQLQQQEQNLQAMNNLQQQQNVCNHHQGHQQNLQAMSQQPQNFQSPYSNLLAPNQQLQPINQQQVINQHNQQFQPNLQNLQTISPREQPINQLQNLQAINQQPSLQEINPAMNQQNLHVMSQQNLQAMNPHYQQGQQQLLQPIDQQQKIKQQNVQMNQQNLQAINAQHQQGQQHLLQPIDQQQDIKWQNVQAMNQQNLQAMNPHHQQGQQLLQPIDQQQNVQAMNQQNLQAMNPHHQQGQQLLQPIDQQQNVQAMNQQNVQAMNPHYQQGQQLLQPIDQQREIKQQNMQPQLLEPIAQQQNLQSVIQQRNLRDPAMNQQNLEVMNQLNSEAMKRGQLLQPIDHQQNVQAVSQQNVQAMNQQNLQAMNPQYQQHLQTNRYYHQQPQQNLQGQNILDQQEQNMPAMNQQNVSHHYVQQQDAEAMNRHYQQVQNLQVMNQELSEQQRIDQKLNVQGIHQQNNAQQLMQQNPHTLHHQQQLPQGHSLQSFIPSIQQQVQMNNIQREPFIPQTQMQPQLLNQFQPCGDNTEGYQQPRLHGYQQPLEINESNARNQQPHLRNNKQAHVEQIKKKSLSSQPVQNQVNKNAIASEDAANQPVTEIQQLHDEVNQTDQSKMKDAPHMHSFGDFARDQPTPKIKNSNGLQMQNISEGDVFMKIASKEERLKPTEPFHRNPSTFRPNNVKPRPPAVTKSPMEVLKTLSAMVLEKSQEKKIPTPICPLERNISAAIQRSKMPSSKIFERQSQIYCGVQAVVPEKKKAGTKIGNRGGTQAPPKVELQETAPQPKLDRPQTLSLLTSSDDNLPAQSEVHEIIVAHSELDNVENDFMRIEVSPRTAPADEEEPQARKTPSHLTDQGYFDLKFYHNKLW